MGQLKQMLRAQILAEMTYDRQMSDEEIAELIDRRMDVCMEEQPEEFPQTLGERLKLHRELFDSFRRLDILQELVDDPRVTEIMVNGPDQVFVETGGKIGRWEKSFESREQLEDLIQQIVSSVNRIVNTSMPLADARLSDGSRVHVVLEPIALNGPILTIRKFPEPMTMERLLDYGSISPEAADLLKTLVAARYNIFVSGGTGAGKTTFLNALSEFIPPGERVITIEDAAELQLNHIENLVRMETREANAEGAGAIGIGELIRAALRMRPDRLIIGEVRGKEALDLLQSLNTGHDGGFSSGHANSVKDMLSRLETMVLMAADLPLAAIRSQIASAVDIMVHVSRMRDKTRKVTAIEEVDRFENGEIILNPLFTFREAEKAGDGFGNTGKVEGSLEQIGTLKHRKNSDLQGIEYETYTLSRREWVLYGAEGILLAAALDYVFYRSFLLILLIFPAGILFPLALKKKLKQRRMEKLRGEFKDAILAVASGLNAGYSVENAFAVSLKEMEEIHGSDSMIAKEIRLILRKVRMNLTFEDALGDFAARSGLDDVKNFADVFLAARKSGGELMRIITRTAEIIGEKIRIQEEILTATASKRMEQRIMSGIPVLIVIYIELTSPGFFGILYTTLIGRMLMTVCLAVYLASCWLADYFLEIEV